MTLTVETLREAMRAMEAVEPDPGPFPLVMMPSEYGHLLAPFYGTVVEKSALIETRERNFPYSKHRSKRILKKLCKRHGGEYRMAPAAYRVGDRIIAHPAILADIERRCA